MSPRFRYTSNRKFDPRIPSGCGGEGVMFTTLGRYDTHGCLSVLSFLGEITATSELVMLEIQDEGDRRSYQYGVGRANPLGMLGRNISL